ncbi:MAG: hypothetical protein ABL930_02675 [Pseudobdellovibrio sp.]
MKQLLIIAVALTAINAQASRARMAALGNSAHLVDTQTVYTNPADMFRLSSDYVSLESGLTGTLATDPTQAPNANAEGMIVRTMGDAKLGLSLGHQSKNASAWASLTNGGLRQLASVAALKVNQQNPIELSYGMGMGDMKLAGTLVYSNYNNKIADKSVAAILEKESSMGVRFGLVSGPWDGSLAIGLGSTAQTNNLANTGSKFSGTTSFSLAAGYQMDSMYFNGGLVTAGAKEETNAGVEANKIASTTFNVGVINSHKKDGNELFYGVSLVSSSLKQDFTALATDDTKSDTLALPLTIGLEVDAASWLTFRGSISQTTFINSSKSETSTTPSTTTANTDPGVNSTTVAFGAGLKFNKLTVDGTISGLTAGGQTIGTNTLLSQVGVAYWF